MDIKQVLLSRGFDRVIVLDGAACKVEAPVVLIALMTYQAEAEISKENVWIHPYYFASQRAYQAASSLVKETHGLALHDELRVKPIFARLSCLSQGRNTLSYLSNVGSRFHVQIFTWQEALPATDILEPDPHPLHCGDCRLCMEACPTKAIDESGFHRERCIRNWQFSGQPVPEPIRAKMENRLLGCDSCQRCCPHNPAPKGAVSLEPFSLADILSNPKAAAVRLKPVIGANLAIPNRILGQACLLAGCEKQYELVPLLKTLRKHPSATVSAHAEWAMQQLEGDHTHA